MRKFLWKRLAAGALVGCLLVVLSACGGLSETDAETYVKGHLDAAYLGIYDKAYIDLVEDMTEDDARELHESNVSDETEYYLLDFLAIDYPNDEMVERAKEVMEKIYAKSKYTVGTGSKTKDGDFVVEVTVSPLDLYSLLTDDDFYDALDQAGFDEAETEEEYEAVERHLRSADAGSAGGPAGRCRVWRGPDHHAPAEKGCRRLLRPGRGRNAEGGRGHG